MADAVRRLLLSFCRKAVTTPRNLQHWGAQRRAGPPRAQPALAQRQHKLVRAAASPGAAGGPRALRTRASSEAPPPALPPALLRGGLR
eukprot:CAMPEP_0179066780 /NCGR_PEP_ID=MMETSP0796-20121207/29150_1 /TAXON_ID=73915 /ORGANISM="Pyrodinium bahamense, Strain pbaha01" /LENGTH=87 /DNA_ID=CAMNT_0020763789 /DNA_START=70 /DNA_END=333 /DNA_ORIENTATION=-